MIEVFKTNVTDPDTALHLSGVLQEHLPGCRVSFDLDDCDRILRVEGSAIAETVILVLNTKGYRCEVLEG